LRRGCGETMTGPTRAQITGLISRYPMAGKGEGLRFRRLCCPASLPETLVKARVERGFISSAPRDRVEQAKNAWEEIYPDSPRPFRCYSR